MDSGSKTTLTVLQPQSTALSIAAAINGYAIFAAADRLSPNTLETHRYHQSKLLHFFGNVHLVGITPNLVTEFYCWLREGYRSPSGKPLAPATINRVWSSVRALFTWAESTLGFHAPDKHVKKPTFLSPVVTAFTQEEVQALLKACKVTASANSNRRCRFAMQRPTAVRDSAIVLTLLDTGLRISELCRLNVGDMQLDTGEIVVRPSRSGHKSRGRVVYMESAA